MKKRTSLNAALLTWLVADQSNDIKIYAVDYAWNLSEPLEFTIEG
jgi:hypothetical protein